jgi:hypothetical protein
MGSTADHALGTSSRPRNQFGRDATSVPLGRGRRVSCRCPQLLGLSGRQCTVPCAAGSSDAFSRRVGLAR